MHTRALTGPIGQASRSMLPIVVKLRLREPDQVEELHRQALAQRRDWNVTTIRFEDWHAKAVQCTVSRPERGRQGTRAG